MNPPKTELLSGLWVAYRAQVSRQGRLSSSFMSRIVVANSGVYLYYVPSINLNTRTLNSQTVKF